MIPLTPDEEIEKLIIPIKLFALSKKGKRQVVTSTKYICPECKVERGAKFPFFQCPACKQYVCLLCAKFREDSYDIWLDCQNCKQVGSAN